VSVKIHPAYDTETRTWFYKKRDGRVAEAPTIRELLAQFKGRFEAVDYYVGRRCPEPVWPKIETPRSLSLRPQSPALQNYGRKDSTRAPMYPEAHSPALPPEPYPAPPARKRGEYVRVFKEPGVLDLVMIDWMDGVASSAIEEKYNLRPGSVCAHVLPILRKKDDPRAIRRGHWSRQPGRPKLKED